MFSLKADSKYAIYSVLGTVLAVATLSQIEPLSSFPLGRWGASTFALLSRYQPVAFVLLFGYRFILRYNYWHATFTKHLSDDTAMEHKARVVSLFFTRLLALYIHDTLACGNDSSAKLSKRTCETLEVKSRKHSNIRFSGVYIDNLHDGFEIRQRPYIDCLKKLHRNADFSRLRKSRAQLS